jgi:hypothetical protein
VSLLAARDVKLAPAAAAAINILETSSDKRSRSVARRVRDLRGVLLSDCLHGEVVGRASIPRALKDSYEVENLYVEDPPSFWRMLYTIVHDGSVRYIVVLDIVDHRQYDRWFPNRGR